MTAAEPSALTNKEHGRLENRKLFLVDIEPTAINWPYARTFVCIESTRSTNKCPEAAVRRYYLSSMEQKERSPKQWLALIRGHWGGAEIRNHWRKDACWMEDKTRSRNKNIVGALALLRNALFAIIAESPDDHESLPAFFDACQHKPSLALRLIRNTI